MKIEETCTCGSRITVHDTTALPSALGRQVSKWRQEHVCTARKSPDATDPRSPAS